MAKYKLNYYAPDDTNYAVVEMTNEEANILKRILSDANSQVQNSYVGIIEVGEKISD